jgi:hypothetical protein
MSTIIANPKEDLISQATERRTTFPRLALRERSQQHPVVMLTAFVAAAFAWTLMPGEPNMSIAAHASAPQKIIQETATTTKTSRLPEGGVARACKGQGWGSESVECLTMIARENGRAEVKVRLIADAAPAHLNTPNIF